VIIVSSPIAQGARSLRFFVVLIALCRHPDQVLETLLLLACRTEHVRARQIVAAKQKLHEILTLVNQLES
jgi:hypothetical protein